MKKPFALHLLAIEAARRLAKQGERAIAVTGSLARGNHGPTSDVDLWVLSSTTSTTHGSLAGVPVTVMRQRFEDAAAFGNLCLFEVDDLWVLHDPDGAFARLRRIHAQNRRLVHATIVDDTRDVILDSVRRSLIGSAWHRLLHLREVAWRAACFDVLLARGWRVPKFRHLKALLPAPVVVDLRTALGLPLTARAFTVLARTWKRTARALVSADPGAPQPSVVLAPSSPARLHRLGAREDAVIAIRRALDLDLLPRALDAAGAWDPAELPAHNPVLVATVAAHGLHAFPEITSTRPTARAVLRLVRRLRTAAHFQDPGEVTELLQAAAQAH